MGRVPPGALMQRAAFGLAGLCLRLMDGRAAGSTVALLVGGGDNGGDTLFAGSLLARRGATVTGLCVAADHHRKGGDALVAAGGQLLSVDADSSSTAGGALRGISAAAAASLVADVDLVLDGIVGIGGSPGLRQPAAGLVLAAGRGRGTIVAVDVPSGVDVDSGGASETHVTADHTVTFGTHKVALLADPAAAAAGQVHLVDIGLAPYLPARPDVESLQATDVAELLPTPLRDGHKYSRGVVDVRAGSARFAGAAVLTVGGALRGGAGLVRFDGPGEVVSLVRRWWPEAVLGSGRTDAMAIGPGLGDGSAAVMAAATRSGLPLVVDADALAEIVGPLRQPAILTPHSGELARMLGIAATDVVAAPLAHARAAAARWQATVLLKGARTVVADPDGATRINCTGTPWLATGGSGDVLTGLAAALLAGGLRPFDAASVAAYLHGDAGERAAGRHGVPVAQDVVAMLGTARQELLATVGD